MGLLSHVELVVNMLPLPRNFLKSNVELGCIDFSAFFRLRSTHVFEVADQRSGDFVFPEFMQVFVNFNKLPMPWCNGSPFCLFMAEIAFEQT